MWPGTEAPARGCHGLAREESCAAMVNGKYHGQQCGFTSICTEAMSLQ